MEQKPIEKKIKKMRNNLSYGEVMEVYSRPISIRYECNCQYKYTYKNSRYISNRYWSTINLHYFSVG